MKVQNKKANGEVRRQNQADGENPQNKKIFGINAKISGEASVKGERT